jgi:hypothetical protein
MMGDVSDVDRRPPPDPDEGGESACWMHFLDELDVRQDPDDDEQDPSSDDQAGGAIGVG